MPVTLLQLTSSFFLSHFGQGVWLRNNPRIAKGHSMGTSGAIEHKPAKPVRGPLLVRYRILAQSPAAVGQADAPSAERTSRKRTRRKISSARSVFVVRRDELDAPSYTTVATAPSRGPRRSAIQLQARYRSSG